MGPLNAHHKQRPHTDVSPPPIKSPNTRVQMSCPILIYQTTCTQKSHIPKEMLEGMRINTSSMELRSIFSHFLHLCWKRKKKRKKNQEASFLIRTQGDSLTFSTPEAMMVRIFRSKQLPPSLSPNEAVGSQSEWNQPIDYREGRDLRRGAAKKRIPCLYLDFSVLSSCHFSVAKAGVCVRQRLRVARRGVGG